MKIKRMQLNITHSQLFPLLQPFSFSIHFIMLFMFGSPITHYDYNPTSEHLAHRECIGVRGS